VSRYLRLFLLILTACLLCTSVPTDGLSVHLLTAPLLTAFLVSWPTGFLPSRARTATQLLFGEAVLVLCAIDCYCQIFFLVPLNAKLFSTILLTDMRETREFLRVFLGWQVLHQWRLAALLLLALLYPLSFFLKPSFPFKPRTTCRLRVAGGLLLALCIVCEAPAAYRYLQLFSPGADLQLTEGLIFRHYHEEVPTPLHRFAYAWRASRLSARTQTAIRRATLEATVDSCSYRSPHIVFVIGESYNKHHSTLYGYHLPTTPLQQRRADSGELYVFTDVVSPWNITSNAFLSFFSLWEHGAAQPAECYPLFPALFRKAGYEVRFFSNQYVTQGLIRSSTSQAGHFFLSDRQLCRQMFSFRNERTRSYDTGLLSQVRHFRADNPTAPHTLDIIHLIGQHFDYAERYPQMEARFKPADYADRALDGEARRVLMHYDNATHFDDVVLDRLLSLYEADEAVVVFVADHGEEVYDDLPVHGRLFSAPTPSQARQEFEVPMWVWCSPAYRERHPEVLQRLEASLHKPFMTDGLPQLFLWLAGIYSRWNDDARNLLSTQYECKPRFIAGDTDYDHICSVKSTPSN